MSQHIEFPAKPIASEPKWPDDTQTVTHYGDQTMFPGIWAVSIHIHASSREELERKVAEIDIAKLAAWKEDGIPF